MILLSLPICDSLCVNLTGSERTHMFCQTSRIFVWGCFWVRLTIQLVDWIKQIALHNVGGPHAISRTMDLPAWWPLNQAISFSWFYSIFWPLDLNWDIGFAGFWTCQPPESHEPISYNPFLCICKYIYFCWKYDILYVKNVFVLFHVRMEKAMATHSSILA